MEEAPAPTLWTMNDARQVSPALLRRMMFALELRPPTTPVRARIWARQLDRHGIEAGPDEALSLATEFEATPGVAVGATAAARLSGGDIAAVRRGVRSLSRLLSCAKPPQGTPARFDPGLVNALPFACTTNFGEHLDLATLRRFVFKVTLDYLTPGQAEAAFRGYVALVPPRLRLGRRVDRACVRRCRPG